MERGGRGTCREPGRKGQCRRAGEKDGAEEARGEGGWETVHEARKVVWMRRTGVARLGVDDFDGSQVMEW